MDLNQNLRDARVAVESIQTELRRTEEEAQRVAAENVQLAREIAQAMVDSARGAAAEAASLGEKQLTQERLLAQARATLYEKLGQDRMRAAAEAVEAEKRGFLESSLGADQFTSSLQQVAAQRVPIQQIGEYLQTFGVVFQASRDRAAEFGSAVSATRNQFADLASVVGHPIGAALLFQNAERRAHSGDGPELSPEFLLQQPGSGGGDIGQTGIAPNLHGTSSGWPRGLQNFEKYGKGAATARLATELEVLQQGKSPVWGSLRETMASEMAHQDEMHDVLPGSNNASVPLSFRAGRLGGSASDSIQSDLPGSPGWSDQQISLREQAAFTSRERGLAGLYGPSNHGVDSAALGDINPHVLTTGAFEKNLSREAIKLFIDRGLKESVNVLRFDLTKQLEGTASAQQEVEGSERNTPGLGLARLAGGGPWMGAATNQLVEAALAAFHEQASGEVSRPMLTEVSKTPFLAKAVESTSPAVSFELSPSNRAAGVDERMHSILWNRADSVGIGVPGLASTGRDEQAQQMSLNQTWERMSAAGGSMARDLSREQLEELRKANQLQQQVLQRPLPAEPRGGRPSVAR